MSRTPNRQSRTAALELARAARPDGPTAERLRDPTATLVVEAAPDGTQVAHYRVGDTLARLLRSGLIAPDWAAAGDRFRRDYVAAQFIGLGAADLRRTRGAGGQLHLQDKVEDARERLWRALAHLGGLSAPTGSVAWHVIGGEMTLNTWMLRQSWGAGRTLRHDMATGVLISALGTLAGHYAARYRDTQRRRPDAARHAVA